MDKKNNINTIEELLHSDYTWREEIWTNNELTIKHELQCQLTQIIQKLKSENKLKINYKKKRQMDHKTKKKYNNNWTNNTRKQKIAHSPKLG